MLLLLAMALALPACGGDEQETGEKQATEQEAAEKDRAGGKGGGASEEVSLEIGGDSGAGFSGACYVGDEEFELDGQAPESFDYDLEGRRLECELLNEGPGSLEIVLVADGTRSVQQLNAGTLNLLTYGDGLVSSSTSSGPTESQQVVSSSVNSGSSAISSSVVNSSSSTSSR